MPPNNHSVMSRFFAEVFLVFLNNIESQHIRYIVDLLVTAADDCVIWVRLFTAAFYIPLPTVQPNYQQSAQANLDMPSESATK